MNSLPTDNLYKFCAIAGLIILGFSVYYPSTLLSTITANSIDITTELDILDVENDFTKVRITKLRQLKGDIIEHQQGRYKPNPATLRLTYSEQELKNLEDEIDRLGREQRTGTAKVKGKLQKNTHLIAEAKFIKYFIGVSFMVGLTFTIYGFFCWYTLVQRPLDEKLKTTVSKESTHPSAAGDA